ncbi:hypothetical protein L596_001417 [Steinernema carpocapsae]|uniref:Uncharacterized protein n=1 Tax=Steinernema carpocapsae TaxID=34508 RepID=A0A4U8UNQ8_STECR|nr:hypothetical protein L596_001417 [Steinernema carpocapsae]
MSSLPLFSSTTKRTLSASTASSPRSSCTFTPFFAQAIILFETSSLTSSVGYVFFTDALTHIPRLCHPSANLTVTLFLEMSRNS